MIHPFFPCKKICEVPLLEVQQQLIQVFKVWGQPQYIKVDNGLPFGDPHLEVIPILSLWLIGMGIQLILNPPGKPYYNGKVERAQGVLASWTEYKKCKDGFDLQLKLWEEGEFYNLHFPIRRKQNRTRIEVYPNLLHTEKEWNPSNFNLSNPLNVLKHWSWERKLTTNGAVKMYGIRKTVGKKYGDQNVTVRLNPITNEWQIFNRDNILFKSIQTNFNDDSLWNLDLSICQRTKKNVFTT